MNNSVCEPVLLPFVGNVFEHLSPALMEAWVERSACVEFEAGIQPRALAEALALLELLRHHPRLISGLSVLQIEVDGATEWLLTTDLDCARRHLAEVGGVEVAVLNPKSVVDMQYGGLARLGTGG